MNFIAPEVAAPSPATPSPLEVMAPKLPKRKRTETIKEKANKNYAAADSQMAVETARKVSKRAAQETQNAEVEAELAARHGASVKTKRLTKKQKAAAVAALLANKENIQDA